MTLALKQVLTIARREYKATVQRRGFWFTVIGTPLFYALLMLIVTKPQVSERVDALRRFKVLAVVDSSGAFAAAPRSTETDIASQVPFPGTTEPKRESFRTEIRFYPDVATAEKALRAGETNQVIVFPPDYVATGRMRRYATGNNMFSSQQDRVVTRWIVRGLFEGAADPNRVERAARPLARSDLYTLSRDGRFELKDDRGELLDFLLPFAFGLLLGLTIVIGGQYLLQGVNEEKESRILESMLCTVSPEELLAGKLIGLGSAGLTLVVSWLVIGAFAAGPAAAALKASVQPSLLILMIAYFLLGYLFYGSLMMGIGSIASNMREAQQFSVWFTFMLFVPFYLLPTLIGNPGSPLAITLSLLPPTAPVSSMLRLAAPNSAVPGWQIAASLTILAAAALVVLWLSARVFRVGMLLYGKTPTLPEILRLIRKG
jgi:ABC-2 type transport system permease protein